jgi:DNA-binding FadR family transcriptional regulator
MQVNGSQKIQPMTAPLQPLDRAPSLHHSVQASLKQFIIDNHLKAGDPLPPEGTLARQLGIGRNSVREGVKALESLGVLEVRRGVGAFVKAFTLGPLLDNLPYAFGQSLREVEEILQIRQALEVSLIEEVVRTMSAADLGELRRIAEVMGTKAARGEDFANEDMAFHQALFAPLGNAMLLALIDTFWRVFYRVSGWTRLETQNPMETYRDHLAIVDAVAARDVATAKQRLAQHYAGISSRLLRRREEIGQTAA